MKLASSGTDYRITNEHLSRQLPRIQFSARVIQRTRIVATGEKMGTLFVGKPEL